MDSFENTLTCSCSCFQQDVLMVNRNFSTYKEYLDFWRTFLVEYKKEVCKHRAFSIFNLPCGNKINISVELYKNCLIYIRDSLDTIQSLIDETQAHQYLIFLTVKENPVEAQKFVQIFKNYVDSNFELLNCLKNSSDTLSFDYFNRYFVLHSHCLNTLEEIYNISYNEWNLEDIINQLAKHPFTSCGVGEDRRTITFEDI